MSERQLYSDVKVRDKEYELWSTGDGSWYLCDDKQVLTDTDFNPPLTHKELQDLYQMYLDFFDQD